MNDVDTITIQSIVCSGNCTGCMACKYICPVGAISISVHSDTFFYPQVDNEKCVKCGKCYGVCPTKDIKEKIENDNCYAVQADDELRELSSSGGFFSIIAETIIEQNGVVCGATFVDNKVEHVLVETKEELNKLRKSKYIQSDCSNAYEKIGEYLHAERRVLFVGTPCQCAAVRNVYGENDSLIVVDILCMGVPSQELFNKYKHEELDMEAIEEIDFRDKSKYGWTQNLVLRIDGDGKHELVDNRDSSFYSAFLDAYSIRECCTVCNYAGYRRVGDFSIGDFWGIERFDLEFDDKKGTSLVLVNTAKGEEIFESVKSKLKKLKEYDIKYAFECNPILKMPTVVSSKRREFFDSVHSMSVKENYNRLKSNKADCGIINYWWSEDNGAILTAFALQRLLEINGYSSRLIDVYHKRFRRSSRGISCGFERKYLYTTDLVKTDEQYADLNNAFDKFIVGSDQVFRAEWTPDRWFLDFVNIDKDKIAMSASFGVSKLNVSRTRKKKINYLLKRFNDISIRETSGVKLCEDMGIKASYVIDPVFLIDKSHYEQIIDDTKYEPANETHVFGYFRDNTDDKRTQTENIARSINANVFIADDTTPVEVFLSMISTAEAVLTDSYHGLCFSLIFNKKFVCYYNKMRGNDRFESLINILKISPKRFIAEDGSEEALRTLGLDINWDEINANIKYQRKQGVEWLMNALAKPSALDVKEVNKAKYVAMSYSLVERIWNKLFHNRYTRKIAQIVRR